MRLWFIPLHVQTWTKPFPWRHSPRGVLPRSPPLSLALPCLSHERDGRIGELFFAVALVLDRALFRLPQLPADLGRPGLRHRPINQVLHHLVSLHLQLPCSLWGWDLCSSIENWDFLRVIWSFFFPAFVSVLVSSIWKSCMFRSRKLGSWPFLVWDLGGLILWCCSMGKRSAFPDFVSLIWKSCTLVQEILDLEKKRISRSTLTMIIVVSNSLSLILNDSMHDGPANVKCSEC